MQGTPLQARHGERTNVSGSTGAAGATNKTNEVSQELNSKPTAAGNTSCDEQAGYFISSCNKSAAHDLVGDMDNLGISLKFKPG